ncbi:hypothetical protein [Sphingobacterium sp. UBA6645]|uniref:hypothetical protein n=1 Tax=Sphingobacterium sp. UBA6645 TaxID=1947511 RepID=UPI0025EF9041|nr:hypothetical protein [Sphingobacterium sp. UBA6645]
MFIFCRTWSAASIPFAISLKAQRIADASGSLNATYFLPSSLLLLIYPNGAFPIKRPSFLALRIP